MRFQFHLAEYEVASVDISVRGNRFVSPSSLFDHQFLMCSSTMGYHPPTVQLSSLNPNRRSELQPRADMLPEELSNIGYPERLHGSNE